jgi:hypothetical protein
MSDRAGPPGGAQGPASRFPGEYDLAGVPTQNKAQDKPRRRPISISASVAGAVAAAVTAAAIYLGSRNLRYFDAALIGYATATIVLAFGVVYRYTVWVSSPPARRYLRQGWRAFLSWRNFRRMPAAVPRALLGYLGLQTFIAKRGRGRWLAHQALFWGVVLATLITFPLTFGWFAFLSDSATGPSYVIYVLGFRTIGFDALSFLGWMIFHGLDIAAVLVIAGCCYFIWRRFRDREATTGQRFGYDFFPLIGLTAISITGLLLTFSSWLLDGRSYDFLAITHMATVVLTLVFIPFGKFFHVIQRPASVGVEVYKRVALAEGGVFACRRCGEPIDSKQFVGDLEKTMGELGLGFADWVETCPRCKRLQRGAAYLNTVKRGYK